MICFTFTFISVQQNFYWRIAAVFIVIFLGREKRPSWRLVFNLLIGMWVWYATSWWIQRLLQLFILRIRGSCVSSTWANNFSSMWKRTDGHQTSSLHRIFREPSNEQRKDCCQGEGMHKTPLMLTELKGGSNNVTVLFIWLLCWWCCWFELVEFAQRSSKLYAKLYWLRLFVFVVERKFTDIDKFIKKRLSHQNGIPLCDLIERVCPTPDDQNNQLQHYMMHDDK